MQLSEEMFYIDNMFCSLLNAYCKYEILALQRNWEEKKCNLTISGEASIELNLTVRDDQSFGLNFTTWDEKIFDNHLSWVKFLAQLDC